MTLDEFALKLSGYGVTDVHFDIKAPFRVVLATPQLRAIGQGHTLDAAADDATTRLMHRIGWAALTSPGPRHRVTCDDETCGGCASI